MKQSRIFCVTSVESLGCTFLDWSIHWLSGQDKFWSCKTTQWADICQNPLQTGAAKNAHNHPKNHPNGWADTKATISLFPFDNMKNLYSFYTQPLYIDHCCRDLGMDVRDISQPEKWKQVQQYQKQDYANMLFWLTQEMHVPCVFVAFDPTVLGYRWKYRSLDRMLTSQKNPSSHQDIDDEQEELFSPTSLQAWQSMGLTQIWDKRERWALNMRPFDPRSFDDFHPPDSYWVNCQDLWFDTDRVVQNIMTWLGLSVDQSRRAHWLPMVSQWQTIHNDQLKFPRALPRIMSAILHDHDYDLPTLSFKEEAIIQHCLMYQHGLNIKTWQLSKFPSNARDIHKLLEPNQHCLDDAKNQQT